MLLRHNGIGLRHREGGTVGVTVWLALVIATIVAWSATSLLYNFGIVMYAYAMAIDSVSTDPIVAT